MRKTDTSKAFTMITSTEQKGKTYYKHNIINMKRSDQDLMHKKVNRKVQEEPQAEA